MLIYDHRISSGRILKAILKSNIKSDKATKREHENINVKNESYVHRPVDEYSFFQHLN